MITTTATQQILLLLAKHHSLRPIELHKITNISRQRIHSQLKSLLLSNQIIRKGRSPLTYYSLNTGGQQSSSTVLELSENQRETLDQDFLIIKRQGTQVTGQRAVCDYAQEHNLNPQLVAEQFVEARDQQKQKAGIDQGNSIDQLDQLEQKQNVETGVIERYQCADFSSLDKFGPTAMAKKVHAAKTSENAVLQLEIFKQTERQIHEMITEHGVEAVAFVPGSTAAGKKFIRQWQEALDLPLPHVNLVRVAEDPGVPQKAISLQVDREDYAQRTLVPGDHRRFKHILLLDDRIISGTTINQAAKSLIKEDVAQRVSAYTLLFDRQS